MKNPISLALALLNAVTHTVSKSFIRSFFSDVTKIKNILSSFYTHPVNPPDIVK